MKRTQSADEIADRRGVHLNTVYNWIKQGCPHTKRGDKYLMNEGEVVNWLGETNRNAKPGRPAKPKQEAPEDLGGDKDYWLTRRYRNECLSAEGELVDVNEIESVGAEILSVITKALSGRSSVLALQMEGRDTGERQQIIEQSDRDILTNLAKGFREMGERCRTAQEV